MIPIDSISFSEILHSHGINVRHLGLICQQTGLPHVREICMIEMVARSAKKILKKQMTDLALYMREEELPGIFELKFLIFRAKNEISFWDFDKKG